MIRHSGNVFVLSAPSGAGKSTLRDQLLQRVPGLIFSISFTTRKPRPGEVHGQDYFFVDQEAFQHMIDRNGLVEWVEVYGNRYGTGRDWIQQQLESGTDILLDIETIGARHLRGEIPDAVMIFLLPPSAHSLGERLRGRGKDTESQIETRLGYARHEMEAYPAYDYLVVNDDLDTASRELESIILATRCRRERMQVKAQSILDTFPPFKREEPQ